jgi:hypothetical protein
VGPTRSGVPADMSQQLIASIGFLGGLVAAMVDGRRSVSIAALAAGLGLAAAASSVGGSPAALVPLVAGTSAALLGWVALRAAVAMRWVPGLDPTVPVVAQPAALFGPRSMRAIGAALALPAASWVSINVPVGGAATAHGAIFAATYVWFVGCLRLLRARALDDLAAGAAVIGIASATGWILEAGPGAIPEASAAAGLAPVAAAAAGWLVGRHRRTLRHPATSASADQPGSAA